MRRIGFRGRFLAVLVLSGVLFVTGVGIGQAGTHWSSYKEVWRSVSQDWCFYARQNHRDPASNPAHDLDWNVWHYMRDYSGGCSPYNAHENFGWGFHLNLAYLTRSSDGVVCSSIGGKTLPSTKTSFGVGRGYSRSGACSSTTQFTIWQQIVYQGWGAVANSFHDFTYVP